MKAREYIIEEIKKFILQFSYTKVRYEFDFNSNSHFIEVVPSSVYHDDNEYISWESKMFDDFVAKYPDQNICFISDDAIIGIEKVDFEIAGLNYDTIYSIAIATINSDIKITNINDNLINGRIASFTTVSKTEQVQKNEPCVVDYNYLIFVAA